MKKVKIEKLIKNEDGSSSIVLEGGDILDAFVTSYGGEIILQPNNPFDADGKVLKGQIEIKSEG